MIVDGGKFYIKVVNGTIKLIRRAVDNLDTENINEGLVKNWPETDDHSGNIRFVSTTQAVADNSETTDVDESAEARTTYKVGNTPGVALPSTGGPGTNLIYFLGIVLTGLAGGGLLMKRRRRDTESFRFRQ